MPFVDPSSGVDSRDLCLVADVKALMQKSGTNAASQDTLIQSLITRASIKIMRDWEREFVPGGPNLELANNATRIFEFEKDIGPQGVFVDFTPYDLQTTVVPTVTLDPDLTTPMVLAATEFRLWPQPASKGVYEAVRIRLLQARAGWPGFANRQVSITGNWGFPSIPYEVTQACAATVIHWITNYPGARRGDQVDMPSAVYTPRSYPMSALDDLNSFKRMTV